MVTSKIFANRNNSKVFIIIVNIFILLFSSYLNAQSKSINIAVNDLKPMGIDSAKALVITEKLRRDLTTTGIFTVLERKEMGEILKEQQLQMTGLCSEASCAIEIGQALGVQQILIGQVNQNGKDGYTLSARIMDVSTSKIVSSVSEEITNNNESEAMRWLIDQIAFSQRHDIFSRLEVEVQPEDAVIKVLGNEQRGRWRSGRITQDGPVIVTVTRPGYFDLNDTLTISFGQIIRKSYILRQKSGSIFIKTTPESAQVFIDGRYSGVTPFSKSVFEGVCAVRIAKDGFVNVTDSVEIKGGTETNLEYPLIRSAGYINIVSEPENAFVSIQGRDVGRTPLNKFPLDTGTCQIIVSKPGFFTQEETINVTLGSTFSKKYLLKPTVGFLSVTSEPAEAMVALNGKNVGRTPYQNNDLNAGKYDLAISLAGFTTITDTIEIIINGLIKKNFLLVHTQEYLDSVKAAKELAIRELKEMSIHKKEKRQWIRRFSFGGLALASLVSGIYIDKSVYPGHIKERDALLKTVRSPDIRNKESAKSDLENYQGTILPRDRALRTVSFIASGVFATGLTISIFF